MHVNLVKTNYPNENKKYFALKKYFVTYKIIYKTFRFI